MRCKYAWRQSGFGCKHDAMVGSDFCAEHHLAMKSREKEITLLKRVKVPNILSNYGTYIKSKEWQAKSDLIRLQHNRCRNCNRKAQLHVHHRTYERLGHEWDADLTVLCKDCHDLFHKNYIYDRKEHIFIKRKF